MQCRLPDKLKMIRQFSLICLILPLAGCKPAAVSVRPPRPASLARELDLQTPEGPCQAKLIFPASGRLPFPALVLLHEDHGLTDWELEQARKLAGEAYVVLAVDLYGGRKVDGVMDAHIMSRALPDDAVMSAVKAALDYLEGRPEIRKNRLGVIGWDMGGGYALDIARRDPRIKACIICYGGVVTDAALLAPMHAAVLGIFADKDVGITDETVAAFRKALAKAGKKHEIKVMSNSPHGFMNPANMEAGVQLDPQAVQTAWDAILTFLAAELKQP
jgi:carboxymethylenebutenolidase